MARFALRVLPDGGWEFYSDDPAAVVYCVDERVPNDRVYRMSHVGTAKQLDALLGNDPVGCLGDSPVVEQAIRAALDKGDPQAKPNLKLVTD